MTLDEFKSNIKKVKESRKHKITGSYSTYDAYRWIMKNKWLNIGHKVSSHDFYSVIRLVNKYLAKELSIGNDIIFPYRMGRVYLIKFPTNIKIINNKIKTTMPIDWQETIKLWYDDNESYLNKKVVRRIEKEIFKIHYDKVKANYKNKYFYKFFPNRNIRKELKNNIKEGKVDTFTYKRYA